MFKTNAKVVIAGMASAIALGTLTPLYSVAANTSNTAVNESIYSARTGSNVDEILARSAQVVKSEWIMTNEATGKKTAWDVTNETLTYQNSFSRSDTSITKGFEASHSGLSHFSAGGKSGSALQSLATSLGSSELYSVEFYSYTYTTK